MLRNVLLGKLLRPLSRRWDQPAGAAGSDDSGNGVSIQARSCLQLLEKQHLVLQRAQSVRDLTCSDRSLVSTSSSTNPCARKKERRQTILNPQEPSTLRYKPFPSFRRWKATTRGSRLTAELLPVIRNRFAGRSKTGSQFGK